MDDIKPTQSLDGMSGGKPTQPSATPQNSDNPGGSSSSSNGGLNQFNDADYAPDASNQQYVAEEHHHDEPNNSGGGSGKALKILLTLFVILFLAAAAAAAYFYMESSKEETPSAESVNVTKLQQQNESLTYDNKTLTTQNTAYQVKIKGLTTTANQLKTKCGSSCSAIVIPQ